MSRFSLIDWISGFQGLQDFKITGRAHRRRNTRRFLALVDAQRLTTRHISVPVVQADQAPVADIFCVLNNPLVLKATLSSSA
jgi:hypothetical protein